MHVPTCDGVNCWVTLPSQHVGKHWTPELLAAAVPAKLPTLEFSDLAQSTPSAPCEAPVKINASSCLEQGLPCAGMGRMFFFSPAIGQDASCSGSFITKNIVLTAGHCCMEEPGQWSPNITFFLDYNDGKSAGEYVPTQMYVPQPWQDASDRTFDWCFLTVNGTAPKHLPTAWAYDPSHLGSGFSSFGWPAEPPYNGKFLFQATGPCWGTSPKWPPSRYDPCAKPNTTAAMLYMTCNSMTPGCSGGPWYDPALGIFGLNSALILAPGMPEIYASPYFGDNFYASCKQVGACS